MAAGTGKAVGRKKAESLASASSQVGELEEEVSPVAQEPGEEEMERLRELASELLNGPLWEVVRAVLVAMVRERTTTLQQASEHDKIMRAQGAITALVEADRTLRLMGAASEEGGSDE